MNDGDMLARPMWHLYVEIRRDEEGKESKKEGNRRGGPVEDDEADILSRKRAASYGKYLSAGISFGVQVMCIHA